MPASHQEQSAPVVSRDQIRQQVRQQIQEQVRNSVRIRNAEGAQATDAVIAGQEAAEAGRAAAAAGREAAQMAREAAREAMDAARATGTSAPPHNPFVFRDRGPPDGVVAMAITFFVVMGLTIVLLPLARAFARRMDRHATIAPAQDISPRLDRIEQAVEAVAIEVERISEGQRFTTKLMAELRGLPASNPPESWPAGAGRIAETVERSRGKA